MDGKRTNSVEIKPDCVTYGKNELYPGGPDGAVKMVVVNKKDREAILLLQNGCLMKKTFQL